MKEEDPYDCGGLNFKQLVICILVMIALVVGCFELGKFVRRNALKKQSEDEKTILYPEWEKAAKAEAKRQEATKTTE